MATVPGTQPGDIDPGQFSTGPPTDGAPLASRVQADLRNLFTNTPADGKVMQQVVSLAVTHLQAPFVGYYQKRDKHLSPVTTSGKLDPTVQSPLLKLALKSANKGIVLTDSLGTELRIVAIPSAANERSPTVMAAVISVAEHDLDIQTAVLDRLASAIVQWRMVEALSRLDWEAHTCAAATELVSHIEASDTLIKAHCLVVNELKQFLECDQVAIGLKQTGQVGCKVRAVSGVAEFDHHSAPIENLAAAMNECIVRDQPTIWPPLKTTERHATLAHRKLIEGAPEQAVISIPLKTIDDEVIGVIVARGSRSTIHQERLHSAIFAFAPHIATAIEVRKLAEPGPIQRVRKWLNAEHDQTNRKVVLWTVIAILLIIPSIPWRHRLPTECVVEPSVRRYSVAPYDGILKSSLVESGDLVVKDQPLARMNDRELQLELSSTLVKFGQARAERDQAMDAHDTGAQKVAKLEMERLELKIGLLRSRVKQLVLASPIDGVVLRGDLEDAEGAPVESGQTLFEIAPLDPINLELAIPEEDLHSVEVNMTVKARLEGYRGGSVTGTITRIAPRSEIRDSKNVFIAEVQIPNEDGALRPGMNGRARISSYIRPLGWIWFHKAWYAMRNFVGI